jgi:two-component system, chemotaxis family, response regulator Rcp1
MPRTAQAVDVLLVEDNPGDIRLTTEAMKDAKCPNRLHIVRDGAEAIAFLHRQLTYASAVRPDLILLDLNLPKKNGREVLEEIKSDLELKRIPVVVLTTSTSEEDVLTSYQLHANSFVAKPVDFESFMEVVRIIDEFWLALVKLPPKG